MFQYVIRRLLLMIPTFLGITFMVFFILQIAPDGPFDRAVRQLKHAEGTSESGVSQSSDVTGDSSQLTPELLEKLRMQRIALNGYYFMFDNNLKLNDEAFFLQEEKFVTILPYVSLNFCLAY